MGLVIIAAFIVLLERASILMLTIALPLTLAWIMFCVGLQLTPADFLRVFKAPKWIGLGLFAQLLLLPLIVWGLVSAFSIPSVIAIGLYLIALSPGGNTSNAITGLLGGNVALSTTLTAISSLIIPFTFPLLLPVFVDGAALSISPVKSFLQLTMISILPMLLGMLVYFQSKHHLWLLSPIKIAQKTSLFALFLVVLITVLSNQQVLAKLISQAAFYVLLLCVVAMIAGVLLAKLFKADSIIAKTFAVEVGIQNAGTAIFVAIYQLQSPELAITPLLYGVLMNVPVVLLIVFAKKLKPISNMT